jgi:outer membrane biosynthesis protein TonB
LNIVMNRVLGLVLLIVVMAAALLAVVRGSCGSQTTVQVELPREEVAPSSTALTPEAPVEANKPAPTPTPTPPPVTARAHKANKPEPVKPPAKTAVHLNQVTFAGPAAVRDQFMQVFRTRSSLQVVPSSSPATHAITLRMSSKSTSKDDATVSCAASIAKEPGAQVVASLRTEAAAAGENTPTVELVGDAASACATELAADVAKWIRSHD